MGMETVTWMWGDNPFFARMNPARWSRSQDFRRTLEDLQIYAGSESQSKRPVLLSISDRGEITAPNVQAAMKILREALGEAPVMATPVAAAPVYACPATGPAAGASAGVAVATAIPVTAAVAVPAGKGPSGPKTEQPPAPAVDTLSAPSVPANFSELAKLNEAELQFMEANAPALDDWIVGLPAVQSLEARGDEARSAASAKARELLEREEEVRAARREHDEMQQRLSERKAAVQQLLKEREELLKRSSPEQMALKLEARAAEADAEAEDALSEALATPGKLNGAALAQLRQRILERKAEKHRSLGLVEVARTRGAASAE
eukprot:TRINITY_DN29745_c0_g1_i2.p1 TRINITY_DN29745_c0_g1~~TRINITY_DN29745_c0_g1_i2.p1  ORF type:complete len:336 (-),score=86.49 TRINITY_DN29745_c0_g1_i2:128-1087(-)